MATQTAKQKALEAVQSLPDDATMEEAAERLAVLAQIDEGLAQLDAGRGISHEDVKRRLGA